MPRRNEIAGGNGRPVGPTEARNQSWKPQGPVGLLQVHWVSLWVRSLQNRWYQKSVEPYVYLPMSQWHDLAGNPIGLTVRNQSWKPQGPVGLLRVHWVSCGRDPN